MAGMPKQQVGVYSTPSTSQTPVPHEPVDIHYYLTEGLEGAVREKYIDDHTFTTAINSQTNTLQASPGTASQYVVFSSVSQDQLTKIDNIRDTHYKRLRFMYLDEHQVLIV